MRRSLPLLRIARRNLRRNVRHSLGSVLAVAVGFVAISLFDGYMTFVTQDQNNAFADLFMMGDLLVEPEGASDAVTEIAGKVLLDERQQAFLRKYVASRGEEVASAMPLLYAWGFATNGKATANFIGFGYDPVEGAKVRGRFAWNVQAGKPLQLAPESSVLLGMGLGSLLECEPTGDARARDEDGMPIAAERPFSCRRDRIQLVSSTESGQLNVVEPQVAGLFDGGLQDMDVKFMQLPLALTQRLLDTKGLSMVVVLLRDRSRAREFGRELVAAARAEGIALAATPWMEHTSGVEARRGTQTLAFFRALVAVVVVVIAAMSVLTTMAKAVSERTREIGTLRSLGFLRRHVVALFALEAALLAAVASAIGFVVTVAATAAANGSGITYKMGLLAQPVRLGVRYLPLTWLGAAAFLSLAGALAAVVPARRAVKARIPDALTHV